MPKRPGYIQYDKQLDWNLNPVDAPCRAEDYGWLCTLKRGHTGDHQAWGNYKAETCFHQWENHKTSVDDTRDYLEAITAKEDTCTNALANENIQD